MTQLIEDVLTGVPTWVLYLTVFGLPFLEASIFLGFLVRRRWCSAGCWPVRDR